MFFPSFTKYLSSNQSPWCSVFTRLKPQFPWKFPLQQSLAYFWENNEGFHLFIGHRSSPSCCLHSDLNTKPRLRSLSSFAVSIMGSGPVVIHENSSVSFVWPYTKDTIAIIIIKLGQWMETDTSVCQHLSLPDVIFQNIWKNYSSLTICILKTFYWNYYIASAYSLTRSNQ